VAQFIFSHIEFFSQPFNMTMFFALPASMTMMFYIKSFDLKTFFHAFKFGYFEQNFR